MTHLLYGADSDTCSTGDNKVTVLNIWSDFIKYKGNDVGLHSQEENITSAHRLLVAGGEIYTQFLIKRSKILAHFCRHFCTIKVKGEYTHP